MAVNEPKLGKLQLVGLISWKSLSWGLSNLIGLLQILIL